MRMRSAAPGNIMQLVAGVCACAALALAILTTTVAVAEEGGSPAAASTKPPASDTVGDSGHAPQPPAANAAFAYSTIDGEITAIAAATIAAVSAFLDKGR